MINFRASNQRQKKKRINPRTPQPCADQQHAGGAAAGQTLACPTYRDKKRERDIETMREKEKEQHR
jgi:hypothetical protein